MAVRVLTNAHSHNDYQQKHPLQDALRNGFISVEADIHLVSGELLVAHDVEDTDPQKTLEKLYLNPLLHISKHHKGWIYPNNPLWLLIDIKSEGESTYEVLKKKLVPYAPMLTEFGPNGIVTQRAVNIVLSGNRPLEGMAKETISFSSLDAKMDQVAGENPGPRMNWVSENWFEFFKWNGKGTFPPEESEKLKAWVNLAHSKGLKLRFWNTPQTDPFWKVEVEHNVDFLETDDLKELRRFLTKPPGFEFLRSGPVALQLSQTPSFVQP